MALLLTTACRCRVCPACCRDAVLRDKAFGSLTDGRSVEELRKQWKRHKSEVLAVTLPPRGGSRAPASPPGGSTRSPTHAAGGDSPDALRKELLREKERRARLERELLSQVTQCKRMEKALDTLRLGRVRPSLASHAAQPSPLCPSCAERERPVRRVVVPAPNRHALRRHLPLRSAVPRGRHQRDVIHQGHVAWATNAAFCFHSDVCCAVLFSCACECCVCVLVVESVVWFVRGACAPRTHLS